jgi:hypothetical protein
MMKRGLILLSVFIAIISFSGAAGAGLSIIGTATYNGNKYNLICEDDQGLIWLDYSNRMGGEWDDYVKWATGLNASGVLSYNFNPGVNVSWAGDWRLPKSVDGSRHYGYDGSTTAGFNITTSELGYLYYKSLDNLGYYDSRGKKQPGWGSEANWGLKKKGPFSNLYSDSYWSCTEYSIYDQHAWSFSFAFGSQSNKAYKALNTFSAIAVRPGKVVTHPVR